MSEAVAEKPETDFYKLRQAEFFTGPGKKRIVGKAAYIVPKRCDLHKLQKLRKTGMSEVAILKDSCFKLYLGKYYRQRLVFRSPGEPHILDNYRSEFFISVKEFRYNPLRTLAFLEKESIFGECGEWIKMERMAFHASDAKPMRAFNLYGKLIDWLNRLKEYMPKSGITHRDICLKHIMYSEKTRCFKLIDFAVAVYDGWRFEPGEIPERFDDQKQIAHAIQEAERLKKG